MPQEMSGAVFGFGLQFSVRSVAYFVPDDALSSAVFLFGKRNLTNALKTTFEEVGPAGLLTKTFQFQVRRHLFAQQENEFGVAECLDVGNVDVEDADDRGELHIGRVEEEIVDISFESPYMNYDQVESYRYQPTGLLCKVVDGELKRAKESGLWYMAINVVEKRRSEQILIFDLPQKQNGRTNIYDEMLEYIKTRPIVYIGGLKWSKSKTDGRFYLAGSADPSKPILEQAFVLFSFAEELREKFGDISHLESDFVGQPHFQPMRGISPAVRVETDSLRGLEEQCEQRKMRVIARISNVKVKGNQPRRFQLMLCECRQVMRADRGSCPKCRKTEEQGARIPYEGLSVTLKHGFIEREANLKGAAYKKFLKLLAPESSEVFTGERLLRSTRMMDDLWETIVRGLKRYRSVTMDVSVDWYTGESAAKARGADGCVSRWLDVEDIFTE